MTMASIIWMTIVLVCMIKQTECKNDQVYYFEPNPGAMWSREKMLEFFSLIDLTKKYVSTETGPGYEVYKNLMLISDKDEHDTKHLNGLSVAELIELNHWNAEKWTEEEIKRREAICKSFISESELLKEELDDDGNRCIKRNLGYYCWSIIQKITYQVKTHKLYDVELKNDITHKQLVMGLRKMRNLGTDQEDRNEFVKNVYKLLARTLNKDEPIQELGGVSVNKLLQLNTWNLLEWTKEEFDRRESVCSELFPVKAIAVRGTNYAILNMSSACQLINQDVFYRVRSDFSDRAAAELAQYGDKLREYFKKTGYDVRRNLTTLNERTKEQEEIIGICKNVVQRFTLSVDPSSLWPSMSDEARRTWDQHYKDCRAVLYSYSR